METWIEVERDLFMCDMRARETLLTALATSHLIWKDLENSFEGDAHSKKLRLQSWIYAFQDAKMMEEEYIRSYVGRILEITIGIKSSRRNQGR